MKTLDEIKQLMAVGDTAKADEALKELLANEPDNLQAKILYGTCRQLLGDEETFKRIHDEITPEMERLEKNEPKAETVSLWKKYHALWMSLIVGGLVLAGIGYGAYFVSKDIKNMFGVATYRGPTMQERLVIGRDLNPSPRDNLQKEEGNKKFILSEEDTATIE